MPRKQTKVVEPKEQKKIKKNLINTMVKENTNEEEHIILQLPLSQQHINNLINKENAEFNITVEPSSYEPNCYFLNENENLTNIQNNEILCVCPTSDKNILIDNDIKKAYEDNTILNRVGACCFWCCHTIDNTVYGMPHNYDSVNDSYLIYGSFCSLQCANAYNFSVHCGSDKVWEINSWIQILGKRYGFDKPIRPAPSRYLLKMFNGHMTIDEFRKSHLNNDKTYLLNIPPMINITTGYEIINTSYLTKITDNKEKLKKNKYVSNSTIDSKLNLIITS